MIGISVEYGVVFSDKGWTQKYHTIYYTHSLAVSLSETIFNVASRPGYHTTFSDWAGPVTEVGGSYGIIGASYGWSTTYTTWSFSIGPGLTIPSFGTGAYMEGTTFLDGAPYQQEGGDSPISYYLYRQPYW
jgi:hypothetical protein